MTPGHPSPEPVLIPSKHARVASLDVTRPSPWDLMDHPELAVLSILEATLSNTAASLLALQPDLIDHDHPHDLGLLATPELLVAENILSIMSSLRDLLEVYRRVLELRAQREAVRGSSSGDDIPF